MPTFSREIEVEIDIDADDLADGLSSYEIQRFLSSLDDDDLAGLLGHSRLSDLCVAAGLRPDGSDDPDADEPSDLDDLAHALISAGPTQLQALPDNTLAQLLTSLTPALCDLTKEIEVKGYLPQGLLQELKLLAGCSV